MIRSAAEVGAANAGALNALQVRVLILCIGCMVLDGFDLQAMSYAAPALIQEWHVPKETLGPVFGAALFGILVGSLLFSVVADKIGRRPVVVWAVTGVAIATLLTARASSFTQLLVLRFIAGIAMGSMLPNAIALAGEHFPPRMRVSLMMIVGCGFTAGAAAGGLISSWLIPEFGWRAVFYVGGALPLIIAAAMWRGLPESPDFHATTPERHTERVPIMSLFRQGRASTTLRLWAIDFFVLVNLYFLSSWLPTIARASGREASDAVLVGAVLQVGGVIGTLALSWLCGRFGFASILSACFVAAAGSIALLGHAALSLQLVFVLVFIAGFGVVGSQPAMIAFAASYYPTRLRSTGIGWVLGVGRVGAIAGPVLAGELLRLDWSVTSLFRAAAVPAVASAALMYSLRARLADG
jgi:AAHS family 4-hydroxybenzoate transporter-like MFS transporter